MRTSMIRSYIRTLQSLQHDFSRCTTRILITDVGHWMSANRLKLNAGKTELLWAGTKHSQSLLGGCGPSSRLGEDTVTASEHVRLLGVTISSDLSTLPMFVLLSLDSESAATLVHAFVSSHVDYCNTVFAWVPKIITDRLQRVLNAAAHIVSHTQKFDRGLSRFMHIELHWLDIPERVQYKLGVPMYRSDASTTKLLGI